MPTELRNIRIEFISLVKAGANGKHIIWKSADGDKAQSLKEIPISKTDDEKRMVYGIVYSPGEPDTDGEFATSEEIEQAAYRFMKARNTPNVDRQHNFKPDGAYVAESWITKAGDPFFPSDPVGSWAVGIKIEAEPLWKSVKEGEIKGLSMAGVADKHPDIDARTIESFFGKMIRKFLKREQLQGENEMDKTEVQAIVQEAVEKMEKPLSKEDMATVVKAAIDGAVKPLSDRIEKLEKAAPGTKQDDDPIQKNADLEKLGAEIAKMVNG